MNMLIMTTKIADESSLNFVGASHSDGLHGITFNFHNTIKKGVSHFTDEKNTADRHEGQMATEQKHQTSEWDCQISLFGTRIRVQQLFVQQLYK